MPESKKIVTIVLPGWSENTKVITPLIRIIEKKSQELGDNYQVIRFPFSYGKKKKELGKFAKMSIMRKRFYSFVSDKGFLNDDTIINIVGYSQGGMIPIYAAGQYSKLRNRINKYISIASPHDGADLFCLAHATVLIVPGLSLAIMSVGSTKELTGHDGHKFLLKKYPEAAGKFFNAFKDRKEDLLQIYSGTDLVAQEKSSTRFLDHMTPYRIDRVSHMKIPQCDETINRALEFLFQAQEVEINPTQGYAGDTIVVSPKGNFEFENNYPILLEGEKVETQESEGNLEFILPDFTPGHKVLQVCDSKPLIENPYSFTVLPYLWAFAPSRGFAGESIKVYGEMEEEDVLKVNNDIVDTFFGEDNHGKYFDFIVPEMNATHFDIKVVPAFNV